MNKYTLITIASIGVWLIMAKKSCVNAKGETGGIYVEMVTPSKSKNKHKLVDEEDTEYLNPVNVDSGDEISGINRSRINLSSRLKRIKVNFDVQ